MTASFAEQEIWHVLIASDDMKRMNVDQLDDAFRLDLVDASTLVWKTGMERWRRLGSIAGLDEPETIARPLNPPPPPPPLARRAPTPKAPNPFASSAPNPFAATVPISYAAPNPFGPPAPQPFIQPPMLKAPVYTPQLRAPDPYVLPKRRVALPSEIDFRRSSHGVRWGRWLVGLTLLGVAFLAAYRENYLRDGARRMGLENKYVHAERRATSWVSARVPAVVKTGLERLALLPGPNALPETPLVAEAPSPTTAPAPQTAAPVAALAPASTDAHGDSDVQTVSLDSLPLEEEAAPQPAAPVEPAAATPRAASRKARTAPQPATAAKRARATEPPPKPVAKASPPRPAVNDTPLKAAIFEAIVNDSKKKK